MPLLTPPLPPELWDTVPPAAQALILAMQAEIAALRAEVAELKSRLGKNSSNSHKPPSSDFPSVPKPGKPKSGRKRGGQPGHEGSSRPMLPPERVNDRINHHPQDCRFCGDNLAGAPVSGAPTLHQVCEIPPIAVTVTEHRLHRRQCLTCRNVTLAELPAEVAGSCFGPNLEALTATLIGGYRLSRRQAQRLLMDLTDVTVSLGTIVSICHRLSESLKAPVEAIAQALPHSLVAYVDETGFKEAGRRRVLWAAVTEQSTYFRILPSRSQEARRELIGVHVPGTKRVSDRYSGYSDIPVEDRGVCHAHLKRDMEGLKGRNDATTEWAGRMQTEQKRLFTLHRAMRTGTVTDAKARIRTRMIKARFGRLLRSGFDLSDPKVTTFCNELEKLWPAIFACLDHPGVAPTNNDAERALRPAVIWRKTCFGTASALGNAFAERLLTVGATCRQQGRNLFQFITNAHQAVRLGLTPPSLLPALS